MATIISLALPLPAKVFAVLPFLPELQEEKGATLHRGKDLTVSPLPSDRIIPGGTRGLSALASLLAPLESLQTGVTRYLLPVFQVDVRTFLAAPFYRG